MPVAAGVVDAADARPHLPGPDERQRERRLLPRVGMRPGVGHDHVGGVRRVLEDVVLPVGVPSMTAWISARMAISASQKRSSSAFGSLSVGSIISVPATGNDTVGAWKP